MSEIIITDIKEIRDIVNAQQGDFMINITFPSDEESEA